MRVLTYEEKVRLFGDPKPIPRGEGGFADLDEEFLKNIQYFDFPVLGRLRFHSKVFHQLFEALKTIEERGLSKEIDIELTRRRGGTFIPRYQRWSPQYPLSSHAFGIAIDLFSVNSEGKIEKTKWSEEFVEVFEKNGFFWGGRFKNFYDPIHFEVCKILI